MATIDPNTSTASHTPTTSHVLITSRKSTTSGRNHLLCQDHQHWDDIPGAILDPDGWYLRSRSRWEQWDPDRVTPTTHAMDELCRNSQCLVCAATAVAVTTRIQNRDPRLQTWPLTKIKVKIVGLVLPDTPAETMPHRSDSMSSNETEYLLRTVLLVAFKPHGSVTNHMWWRMEMRLCLRFITTPAAPGEGKLFCIEPCDLPLFTPSLLKSWIQTCDTVHGSDCGAMHIEETRAMDEVFERDFRVIDVFAMQVLKPTELIKSVRFVALSYMWPKGTENNSSVRLETQNLGSLEAPGGLKNLRLPPVISDAISLSRDLGERYLWVDRLCIVQDDAQSKHHQICGMDQVYSLATFTIIAALNDTEARGLPGFRGCPRQPWNYHPSHDFDVANADRGINFRPKDMQAFVDNSLWNRRGWTFQERVMSRRRLFITEAEVIFECGRGEVHEEVASRHIIYQRDPQKASLQIPLVTFLAPSQSTWFPVFRVDRKTALSTYCSWISNYTARRLTFEDDILNAFAGVGNMFSRMWYSSPMLFGLPEIYLAQTLVWSCSGSMVHRKAEALCIPSWSWATSVNRVDYTWPWRYGLAEPERIVNLVCFHYQDPDTHELRPLDVLEQGGNTVTDFQSQVKYDLHLNPIACDLAGEFPGALVFNTTIASLRVGRHKVPGFYVYHNIAQASIDGHGGELVGWINVMDPGWDDGTMFDFIVIGGSPLQTDALMEHAEDNSNSWRLNMLE